MQGMRFCVSVHIHGTLSANAKGNFQLPCSATLVEVGMCNSANSDMILVVGTSADANGIITGATGGDSDTPLAITPASFDGALCDQVAGYHCADNTIIDWDLDYDGSSGTAAANVMLTFWFLEG